jgi:hypothetical protein
MSQDYEAFVKRLEETYPNMFSQRYGGIAVSQGWWPIIETLCANIQSHTDWWNKNRETRPVVEQVVVEQIKEKFGGLRFYYSGGDDTVAGMVRMAEAWADIACEECGAAGKRRSGGWIRTLCDHHEAEHQERLRDREMKSSGLEE